MFVCLSVKGVAGSGSPFPPLLASLRQGKADQPMPRLLADQTQEMSGKSEASIQLPFRVQSASFYLKPVMQCCQLAWRLSVGPWRVWLTVGWDDVYLDGDFKDGGGILRREKQRVGRRGAEGARVSGEGVGVKGRDGRRGVKGRDLRAV